MYAVATDHTKPRKGSNHGSKLPKAVNMTKHGGDMTKHVTNRIHYFEQLQKQIDAHSTKAESIALRKTWLEKQKKINYTNEYDRIRSHIAQNQVTGHHGMNHPQLQQRAQHLINLGAQSLNGIH